MVKLFVDEQNYFAFFKIINVDCGGMKLDTFSIPKPPTKQALNIMNLKAQFITCNNLLANII